MRTTAVITEEEPILWAQLQAKLVRICAEVTIVADGYDDDTTLEVIDEYQPQLAFLTIQMPEMAGVEVAKSLAANRNLRCHVVFATAFDHYALDASDANAVNYVLKSHSAERLQAAVNRLKPDTPRLTWIKASLGNRLIPVDEVLFFQSDANTRW